MQERLGIVGSGAIATGLAATAAQHGEAVLVARSEESAERARRAVEKLCGRLEGADPGRVRVVTDPAEIASATYVVEAVAEDHELKCGVLKETAGRLENGTVLATTTSSLSVTRLAEATGRAHRFVGLHVFNPVPRMDLVEVAFPEGADQETRDRTLKLCADLGKTAVEVPDEPGFVVNKLLFPYLFSAVELMEAQGLTAEQVDTCMKLGAGMPMGPLALIDFVGLDVSKAIGEEIGATIPRKVDALIAEGALGKKAGRGFYDYAK